MALHLPSDEVFLTTEEVLEYLQVNLRTVYRLIKAGKIPAVRVGRQWRFRKRDIDAWLDTQRRNLSRLYQAVHRSEVDLEILQDLFRCQEHFVGRQVQGQGARFYPKHREANNLRRMMNETAVCDEQPS